MKIIQICILYVVAVENLTTPNESKICNRVRVLNAEVVDHDSAEFFLTFCQSVSELAKESSKRNINGLNNHIPLGHFKLKIWYS